MKTWSLGTDCTGVFKKGDKVRTRGDMSAFNLVVTKIHNGWYAECRGYGKLRHFNLNVLEHRTANIAGQTPAARKDG